MLNKALRRNVIPATALLASSTTTSKTEQLTWGHGLRFYITVSGASTTGGTDNILLCGVPPGTVTPVPIVGFGGVSFLSQNGVWMADFYPGAWLPATVASGGHLLGAAGIIVPTNWAVQLVLAAGSAATITVDAEMLP